MFFFHYHYYYYYSDFILPQLFGFSPSFLVILEEKGKKQQVSFCLELIIPSVFFIFCSSFSSFSLICWFFCQLVWFELDVGGGPPIGSGGWAGFSRRAAGGGAGGRETHCPSCRGRCCRSWKGPEKVLKGPLTLFDCIWTQPSLAVAPRASRHLTLGAALTGTPPTPQIRSILHRISSFIWVFLSIFPLEKICFEDVGALWCHRGL